MKTQDIIDYQHTDHQVAEVHGPRMIVDMGDDLPKTGSLLKLGEVVGRVTSQMGQRRLEVLSLSGRTVEVGTPASLAGSTAHIVEPKAGSTQVGELTFLEEGVAFAPRTLEFMELDGRREPLTSSWPLLDACAPLVSGGMNLVIDQTDGEAFAAIVAAVAGAKVIGIDAQGTHQIFGETDYQKIMAFRVGMAWAAHLRDEGESVFLVAKLPQQAREPMDPGVPVASLSASLGSVASTQRGAITTILGLCLAPDHPANAIVETLALGEFDAQVFVNPNGEVDLLKSTSNASLSAVAVASRDRTISTLGRAIAVREKTAIFGEEDLEDTELDLLRHASEQVVRILAGDVSVAP